MFIRVTNSNDMIAYAVARCDDDRFDNTLNQFPKKTAAIQRVVGIQTETLNALQKQADSINNDNSLYSTITGILEHKANASDVYTKTLIQQISHEPDWHRSGISRYTKRISSSICGRCHLCNNDSDRIKQLSRQIHDLHEDRDKLFYKRNKLANPRLTRRQRWMAHSQQSLINWPPTRRPRWIAHYHQKLINLRPTRRPRLMAH